MGRVAKKDGICYHLPIKEANMRTRYVLWCLAAVSPLLLAACAFHADYPKAWSNPLKAGGCAGLAGDYLEIGEGFDGVNDRPQRNLGGVFITEDKWQRDPHILDGVDRVELRFDNSVLTARMMRGTEAAATARFSEKDKTLRCSPEGAAIAGHSGFFGSDGTFVGHEDVDYLLAVTADGSLVVKQSVGAVGLVVMLFPAVVSQTDWMRFASWHQAPPGK
jgi:hypothetical protein